jgi:hypothetical protein
MSTISFNIIPKYPNLSIINLTNKFSLKNEYNSHNAHMYTYIHTYIHTYKLVCRDIYVTMRCVRTVDRKKGRREGERTRVFRKLMLFNSNLLYIHEIGKCDTDDYEDLIIV